MDIAFAEIPSDLLDQLKELQDQVARIQKNRDKVGLILIYMFYQVPGATLSYR